MSSPLLKTLVGALVLVLLIQGLGGSILSASNTVDGSVALGADGERAFARASNITEVRSSTGRAVHLSKDAELQISGGLGVEGEQWTWSAMAAVDNTSRDQVIWSIRDEWILAYDGSQPAWVLWHYNRSSTNSYRISVPASGAGSLTTVQATRENATVTLYNSSGSSTSVTLTPGTDRSATAPTYGSLDGRLEETRVAGRVWNASERQFVRSNPNLPLPGDRRSRLMMDQTGRSVAVDLRSASGEVVGSYGLLAGARGTGVAGTTLTEGTHYQLTDQNGITLTMIGAYERAPRVVIQTPDTIAGTFAPLIVTFALLIVLVTMTGRLQELIP